MNRPVDVYTWVRKQPEESTSGYERVFDYSGVALGVGVESEDTGVNVELYSVIVVEDTAGNVAAVPVALIRFRDK